MNRTSWTRFGGSLVAWAKNINVLTLLLSVLLAFGLWLYVTVAESPTGEKSFSSVSVNLSGTDTLSGTYGFSVLTGYDTEAVVTLRGRQSDLNALRTEELSARVDLSDITAAGSYQKKILVTPPAGMEVVRTSPEYVVVEVDVEKTVSVPVLEPEETYTLKEGVSFRRTYSAETVSVKGPQTVVDKIYGVKCLVDLGEFTENLTKTVPLRFVDRVGNEITDRYLVPAQNTLSITYTLYKEKTVSLVLDVTTLLAGEKVTQRVTPSTITVQGAPHRIDALEAVVAKKITTADLDSGTNQFSGTVVLPEGLTCPTGNVTYTAEASLSGVITTRVPLSLTESNVMITPPIGLNYRFAQEQVNVNVRTRRATLSQVDSSALVASVNLSSYTEPGTYPVNVTLSVEDAKRDICYVADVVTVNVILEK